MISSIIISSITILGMIVSIIKFPNIKIKEHSFQTFYFFPVIGAMVMLLFHVLPVQEVYKTFVSNSSVNPIKILILFFSLSFLSIIIDELGFFQYVANYCVKKFHKNQYSLFFTLYILIALLTIFTSNDIVILTFTPLICFFSKKMNISPLPYLFMEFIVANTYSILLPISNPTNIYFSTYYHLTFTSYISVMLLPTIMTGIASIILLLLLFKKNLKKPINADYENDSSLKNKPFLYSALSILCICIILLSISSWLQFEMYIICLIAACILFFLSFFFTCKEKDSTLKNSLKRLPYPLIFFILSMFIIVLSLSYNGVIASIASFLLKISKSSAILTTFIYGITGLFTANLINNIPMTIAYSSLVEFCPGSTIYYAIYASIAASNIGAYLTPIGALAGIMWMNILQQKGYTLKYTTFMKYGVAFSLILLIVSLLFIYLSLL